MDYQAVSQNDTPISVLRHSYTNASDMYQAQNFTPDAPITKKLNLWLTELIVILPLKFCKLFPFLVSQNAEVPSSQPDTAKCSIGCRSQLVTRVLCLPLHCQ